MVQSDYPPPEAITKFLDGTTRHTRRVEIYEQDGITRWVKDTIPRLKDGGVSVDYDRDERRTLDLTLDNSDGVLENAPGEFWYDKIIKVFRGVLVEEPTSPPRVLVVADAAGGAAMATAFRAILVGAGFGDVSVNTIAGTALTDFDAYDIIVALSNATGTQVTTMISAYRAGKSVLVFDTAAVAWAAQAVTGETSSTVSPDAVAPIANLAHPVAQGWSAFTLLGSPLVAADTFARVASSTWGTADTGGAWSNAFSAGGATSNFSTNGYGEHLIVVAAAIARESTLAISAQDIDVTYDIQCNQVPAQRMDCSFLGRYVDTNNNYLCMTQFTTAGNIDLVISRRNAGTVTTIVTAASAVTAFSTTAWYRVRFRLIGTSLRSKIWAVGSAEPAAWTLSTTDATVTASAGVAFRTVPAATTTVAGLAIRFDNLAVSSEGLTGGDTTAYNFSAVTTDTITPIALVSADTTKARVSAWEDPGSGGRGVVVSAGTNNTVLAIPDFGNLIISAVSWLDKVLPIYDWETQIGEFMIERISEPNFPHEMKITGRDYTKKCQASKFAYSTQFDPGYALESLISSIASNAGILKKQLPVTGITVGKTFYYDRGATRWDAMKEIATAYNYDLYFNAQGTLVMTLFVDPSTEAPTLYIQTGTAGQIASYEKATTDARIYNFVLVTGESSDASVPNVSAIAVNDDPASPTSRAEIGERVYQFSSSFIITTQQAQDVADKFLAIHSLEEFELKFDTLMLPWLDVGQILGFIDPNPAPGDPNSFLLTSLTFPLSLGPMSGGARRLTIVG